MVDFAILTQKFCGLLENELVRIVRKCRTMDECYEVAPVGKIKGPIVPAGILEHIDDVGEIHGPKIVEKEMVFLSRIGMDNIPAGSIVKVDSVHMLRDSHGNLSVKVGVVEPLSRHYLMVDRSDVIRPADIKETDAKIPLKHLKIVCNERGEQVVLIPEDIRRA